MPLRFGKLPFHQIIFQSSWLWNWSSQTWGRRLFSDYFRITWEFCHYQKFHSKLFWDLKTNSLLRGKCSSVLSRLHLSDWKSKQRLKDNNLILWSWTIFSLYHSRSKVELSEWVSEANLARPVKAILRNSAADGGATFTNLERPQNHKTSHHSDLVHSFFSQGISQFSYSSVIVLGLGSIAWFELLVLVQTCLLLYHVISGSGFWSENMG